ncbi:unnamed protein product [Blepharisma stoltei]|uniref:FYVE-type domain-containing protein n=1 Tax=Blepharisma stoltei TaxID=1481888 RepID=A0AAU9IM96_9CILI|nr:unnamed protein product [Blepharisma stoltei]
MSSDEDSSSEGEKCSPGPQDYFIIMSNVFNPQANRKAYRLDKICIVCSSKFSLLGSNKKHHCKFCFRGVCRKCSTNKGYQPELQGRYRICDNCYNKALESQKTSQKAVESTPEVIEDEANESAEEKKYEELTKKLEEEFSAKKAELEAEISKINEEKGKIELEENGLRRLIEDSGKEMRKKDIRIIATREKIQELKKDTTADRERVKELHKLIKDQEVENDHLKEKLEETRVERSRSIDSIDDSSSFSEKPLKQTLDSIKEQTDALKQEIDEMKNRMDEIREELNEKKAEAGVLEKTIEMKSTGNPEPEEESETSVRELQEKIMRQQHEIQALNNQLTKQGVINGPDSESRGICRCVIC